ncbi:MAG: ROK family protein [bacterium]
MAKAKKTNSKKTKYVAGIDLGGTNVVVVITTEKGKVLATHRFATQAQRGVGDVLDRMALGVGLAAKKVGLNPKDLWRVGVGAPGFLNSKKGIVINSVNLAWKNILLKKEMEKRLKIFVGVENDANVATYAEKWTGAAKGVTNVVGLTLGTGVGGGIILNDKLIRGVSDTGAEMGHVSVDIHGEKCLCGNYGCLELYASATGIKNLATKKIRASAGSIMTEMVKGDLNKLTSKIVYEAVLQKDKAAIETWALFIKYLSFGVTGIINTLNPEVIVLAGGVINAGDQLFVPLREEVKKTAIATSYNACRLVPAKLGELAGAIGAAGIVVREGEYYGF